MTLKSGTGQACAACKYQRRRCTPECLLAPFFPADQPKMFQNVHRLFGVKHIQNLLKELDPEQKPMAMKSIKFHAAMRDKYPVHGCMVEIQQLNYQLQLAHEELQAVLQQLEYYRQQHNQQEMKPTDDYLSQLQLGMAPPGNASMPLINQENINNGGNINTTTNDDYGDNQQQQQCNVVTATAVTQNATGNGKFSGNNAIVDSSKGINDVEDLLWIQQAYSCSNNENANSMVMQSHLTTAEHVTIPQGTNQNYSEMHAFFDNIHDDRQSYIDSREAYESSLESSLKDPRQSMEQIAENELKSAAACFSLTSVN